MNQLLVASMGIPEWWDSVVPVIEQGPWLGPEGNRAGPELVEIMREVQASEESWRDLGRRIARVEAVRGRLSARDYALLGEPLLAELALLNAEGEARNERVGVLVRAILHEHDREVCEKLSSASWAAEECEVMRL